MLWRHITLAEKYNKIVVLVYEFIFISFSVNIVALLKKTRACLSVIGYQGMLVKTLAAPPNS